MHDFLLEIASRNIYNPVMDWIASRGWDGGDHIGRLADTIECPLEYPDDLKRILMTKWLISAAAAASGPDTFAARGVLVLQGEQGIGKTSWFRRLVSAGSGLFSDALIFDPADRDNYKLFVSHWIVELGELEATFKRTDIARLKGFITKTTDLIRLPWAKKMSEYPRRTVLCASVNDKEVLRDKTGNSRWWMIPCVKINYLHDVDVQQVWAEARARYESGEEWWLSPEEEARLTEENREFEEKEELEEILYAKLAWHEPRHMWTERTVTEILLECGYQVGHIRSFVSRAGKVLRALGASPGARFGHNRDRLVKAPNRIIGM
jgi:putative DNA primase/helicase